MSSGYLLVAVWSIAIAAGIAGDCNQGSGAPDGRGGAASDGSASAPLGAGQRRVGRARVNSST